MWGRTGEGADNITFQYFLRVAQGSAAEVETGLLLADRLHFAPHDRITLLLDRIVEVQKMLRGLVGALGGGGSSEHRGDLAN